MCSLHLTHPSAHTHTHLEQWEADTAASGEQLGVRYLAQGSHLSRGQFLPEPRFKPTTLDYKSNALSNAPRLPRALTRLAGSGPHGQHCDRCVHQPTRWSTLPSHVATRPPTPPLESEASEVASRNSHSGLAQPGSQWAVMSCAPRRVETPSPDGPADLETFRTRTGRPVRIPRDFSLSVVLLPDDITLWHERVGTQLAAGPLQVCISPSEPCRTDTVQDQGGRGANPTRGAILAHSDLVPRADAPRDSPSLADSSEVGSTDSETGHLVAPASRPLETLCLVPRWHEVLGDLHQEVVDTITSRDMLTPWSGTCSSNGALLIENIPGSARSESCCPSCIKGWCEGCLPPPLKSI